MPVRLHRRISPYSQADADLISHFRQLEETIIWFGNQSEALRKAKEQCDRLRACLDVTPPISMPVQAATRLYELAVAWIQWSIPFDSTAAILKFSLDQFMDSINNAHDNILLTASLMSDW